MRYYESIWDWRGHLVTIECYSESQTDISHLGQICQRIGWEIEPGELVVRMIEIDAVWVYDRDRFLADAKPLNPQADRLYRELRPVVDYKARLGTDKKTSLSPSKDG